MNFSEQICKAVCEPDTELKQDLYLCGNRKRHCANQVTLNVNSKGCSMHGRVVTLSSSTSEARVQFTALPQVGKLVVACPWSAVYSTEP